MAKQQPARRTGADRWLTVFWLAMVVFYVLFTIGALQTRGMFEYMGSDYVSFRAAADVVVQAGLPHLYDLAAQDAAQRHLLAYATGQPPESYAPAPMVYLPPFVVLFLPLLLLPPVAGFVVWTCANLALLVWYIRRLAHALDIAPWTALLPPLLVSAPVFATWFFGQVSVLLLIAMGEFLLAWRRGKELTAGLWLAGLLLKPQTLILILPGLLLKRRFRILAGFAFGGLALLLVSLGAVGIAGMVDLGRLLLGFSEGMASTNPFVMTNWRSLAIHLDLLLPPGWAWGIAGAGIAGTALAALALWLRPEKPSPAASPGGRVTWRAWLRGGEPCTGAMALAVLGTYAATCAVTWHAHVNLALAMVAPLLLLRPRLPQALWTSWLVAPAVIMPIAFVLVPQLAHNLVGLSLFLLNLLLLGWSAKRLWRSQPEAGGVVP